MHSRILVLLVCLCLVPAAYAATGTYYQVSAGTGFFINSDGDLITNAHVVHGCQSINILTRAGEKPAKLSAIDEEHDLALIRASDMGGSIVAPMRWNIRDLKIGDSVNIIGFPGASGVEGNYTYKKTSVTKLQGPSGEPLWIQLESVAQKGNSGGPVLDGTGNVIAVISGVAQTYRVSKEGIVEPTMVGQSDIAITLSTLQDFLHRNAVRYYETASGLVAYTDEYIAQNATRFTVPVRCVQGVITQ